MGRVPEEDGIPGLRELQLPAPIRHPPERFCDLLGEHDVLVLPGSVTEIPGCFRISLTANDEMIERGLPGFAAALEHARAHPALGAAERWLQYNLFYLVMLVGLGITSLAAFQPVTTIASLFEVFVLLLAILGVYAVAVVGLGRSRFRR